ncbi:MAG: hypothetical protein NXI16_04450 [Alphaproteobacteria bacterium]|nr:hypothetical protein [Alphaproteobacteria bacterium]
MADYDEIASDVRVSIKEAVIEGTTIRTIEFSFDLVPSDAPLGGLGMALDNWDLFLKNNVVPKIHSKNPAYSVLTVEPDDAPDTHGSPLSALRELYTERLFEALLAQSNGGNQQ